MCTWIFLVHQESCMYHIQRSWNFGSPVKWRKCILDNIALTRRLVTLIWVTINSLKTSALVHEPPAELHTFVTTYQTMVNVTSNTQQFHKSCNLHIYHTEYFIPVKDVTTTRTILIYMLSMMYTNKTYHNYKEKIPATRRKFVVPSCACRYLVRGLAPPFLAEGGVHLCSSRRLDWIREINEKKSSSGTVGAAGTAGISDLWSSIRDP